MDFITIVAVALGLSFDTFAVSLSLGVVRNKILFRQAVPVAVVLAIFQSGLLVAGYFLGSLISDIFKAADHWVALILLSFLGIKMIIEGLRSDKNNEPRDYRHPVTIITIAVGTSIDAFAVGISFALLNIRIWYSALIIGIVTFLASMTAIRIGKSAGDHFGRNAELIGGLILIIIGIKIFIEHMFNF
jgi:putative Mn2+ efflux pump MntP